MKCLFRDCEEFSEENYCNKHRCERCFSNGREDGEIIHIKRAHIIESKFDATCHTYCYKDSYGGISFEKGKITDTNRYYDLSVICVHEDCDSLRLNCSLTCLAHHHLLCHICKKYSAHNRCYDCAAKKIKRCNSCNIVYKQKYIHDGLCIRCNYEDNNALWYNQTIKLRDYVYLDDVKIYNYYGEILYFYNLYKHYNRPTDPFLTLIFSLPYDLILKILHYTTVGLSYVTIQQFALSQKLKSIQVFFFSYNRVLKKPRKHNSKINYYM